MKINQDNWTFAQFHSNPLRAFVSLGAAPVDNSDEVQMQYLVTLTDQDYQELYQSVHNELPDALLHLNEKYGHWELKDSSAKSGDGCSSCVAH